MCLTQCRTRNTKTSTAYPLPLFQSAKLRHSHTFGHGCVNLCCCLEHMIRKASITVFWRHLVTLASSSAPVSKRQIALRKSYFFVLCRRGSPVPHANAPLPNPEKFSGVWVLQIICFNCFIGAQIRDRLCRQCRGYVLPDLQAAKSRSA